MIEKTILDYMTNNLDCGVYMEIPRNPQSNRYVIIKREGRSVENKITESIFAFQSYGASLLEAAELNEQVEAAAKGLVTLDTVSRASLNSSYNFTDSSTKQYRYQCIYEITHY